MTGLPLTGIFPNVESRTQRVKALADYISNNPDRTDLTGTLVEKIYESRGIEVSTRQARRDLEDARRDATERLHAPDLPHWSEDVTGSALRTTIEKVLRTDPQPTIPQLRRAVAAQHGRAIGDDELQQIARTVYTQLYIDPMIAKAEETLRDQPGSSWATHQARRDADPLNYPTPFGPDPNMIRHTALTWCNALLRQLSTPKVNRADLNTVIRTLRLMRDLADDLDHPTDQNTADSVTVSRLDQIRYD